MVEIPPSRAVKKNRVKYRRVRGKPRPAPRLVSSFVGLTSAVAQVTDAMASGLILFQREPLWRSNRHMGTESES